jgi:hypothetical protein
MSQIDGIVFDIETGPMPEEILTRQMPRFSAPGNWKDEDKIAARIREQEENYIKKAALSAQTGQVLAIGLANGNKVDIWDVNQYAEREIIGAFWDAISEAGPFSLVVSPKPKAARIFITGLKKTRLGLRVT